MIPYLGDTVFGIGERTRHAAIECLRPWTYSRLLRVT